MDDAADHVQCPRCGIVLCVHEGALTTFDCTRCGLTLVEPLSWPIVRKQGAGHTWVDSE